MPGLLNFVACRLVVLEPDTGELSLVGVVEVARPLAVREPHTEEAGPLAESRFLLSPTVVYSQWLRQDGDEGAEFEQHISIVAPDGRETELGENIVFQFRLPFHRCLHKIGVIP